jgi:hypothetical protein
VFLTRLLDAQAERCPPFCVFFALTFSDGFAADHPNVTVTALGGASAGRRFFAGRADNVIPANISDISGLVSSGRLPIELVLLQVSGPDATGRYNAGLGIEHLHATIGRARLVIAQVNPELPWTHGDTAIEPGLIDVLVPAAVPPMELPARPAGPIDRAIADHVARLIPDHATIELGPRRDSPGGDQRARPQARSRRPFGGDRRRDRRSAVGLMAATPAAIAIILNGTGVRLLAMMIHTPHFSIRC